MLLVYTSEINNRILYTFETLFTELLGVKVALTDNLEEFTAFSGAKMAYNKIKPVIELEFLWQASHSLLFEEDIKPQNTTVFLHNKVPAFFEVDKNSLLPFDFFAATFYMVSRYEEVLNPDKIDEHGRFLAHETLAFKNQFLHIPVVDLWCEIIKEKLLAYFPGLSFRKNTYTPYVTVDVDYFYAYRHKPLFMQLGSLGKRLKELKIADFFKQIGALSRLTNDPFEKMDVWQELYNKNNLNFIFFVHCGPKTKYDPGFYKSLAVLKKLKKMKEIASIGIHPSYFAFNNQEKTSREKQLLQDVCKQPITKSRQHFIRLQIPETYEILVESGITDDYTMGFPMNLGFRAGTSRPFRFFNLKKNKEIPITIHPFCITDIALTHNADTVFTQIENAKEIIQSLKKINGNTFVLCHSHFLGDRFDSNLVQKKVSELINLMKN